MLRTSSIKYAANFKGGTFISYAVVHVYLYYTALLNKARTQALCIANLDKFLRRS